MIYDDLGPMYFIIAACVTDQNYEQVSSILDNEIITDGLSESTVLIFPTDNVLDLKSLKLLEKYATSRNLIYNLFSVMKIRSKVLRSYLLGTVLVVNPVVLDQRKELKNFCSILKNNKFRTYTYIVN
jgi:hypothetical protein